jgi:putative protein kinase ArgK-like GTPase of G3E family
MAVGSQDGGNARQGQQSQRTGAQGASQQPAEEWDAIKGDVSEMADAAVAQGRHFLDSARQQATTYVDHRKDDAANSVADLAQSLRDACQQFEERPNIRAFVDSAAEGLDQLAETIRARSFNEIFDGIEDTVRRRPATVALTTMVAGFLVARFIKSSAEGIRQAEMTRRRNEGQQRGGAQRSGQGGQRARAQAAPGSPYGQGQV